MEEKFKEPNPDIDQQQHNQHHHHHDHAGMSSRSFLDAKSILEQLGNLVGKKLVDIGSGDGHFSITASDQIGDSGRVYSIDVDEPSINSLQNEISQKRIRNITTILTDFTKGIQIDGKSIDICLMVNVFHGFVVNGEHEQVIKEIKRLLKHTGILVIIEFKKIPNTHGPPFEDRLSVVELEKIIGPHGFKKERITEVGPMHYAVVFSK